jgi:hypothetical protein
MLFKTKKLCRLLEPTLRTCFVFGMSDMQFCKVQLRAVKDTEKSDLLREGIEAAEKAAFLGLNTNQ